jgi:hypothetical protein
MICVSGASAASLCLKNNAASARLFFNAFASSAVSVPKNSFLSNSSSYDATSRSRDVPHSDVFVDAGHGQQHTSRTRAHFDPSAKQ